MLSWNTTRTLCAVLLIIPILHLAFLVSRDTLATLDSAPATWEPEIARLQAIDNGKSLPEKPIVVIGGRRVSLWQGLEGWLSPFPVLMRGIGDATVTDLLHYHERLISYYRPRAVILLPDVSEFHIRDNKSGAELASAIKDLVDANLSGGSQVTFYILPPLVTPRFHSDKLRIQTTTDLLSKWADETPQVTFVNANPVLTDGKGNPISMFYRADGVHLNNSGYQRLAAMLRQQVVDLPQNQ